MTTAVSKVMSKAMVAVTLLAGCGDASLRWLGTDEAAVAVVPEEVVAQTHQGLSVDLRMRAIGAEKFSALQLFVDEVRVSVDGAPVPAQMAKDLVDLADMDHAVRVANLRLPEGAQEVEFTVRLAPSGYFAGELGDGWLDARSTVLVFKSRVENLAKNGKAVIEVNAAKTFTLREAGTLAMVPKYRVEY